MKSIYPQKMLLGSMMKIVTRMIIAGIMIVAAIDVSGTALVRYAVNIVLSRKMRVYVMLSVKHIELKIADVLMLIKIQWEDRIIFEHGEYKG